MFLKLVLANFIFVALMFATSSANSTDYVINSKREFAHRFNEAFSNETKYLFKQTFEIDLAVYRNVLDIVKADAKNSTEIENFIDNYATFIAHFDRMPSTELKLVRAFLLQLEERKRMMSVLTAMYEDPYKVYDYPKYDKATLNAQILYCERIEQLWNDLYKHASPQLLYWSYDEINETFQNSHEELDKRRKSLICRRAISEIVRLFDYEYWFQIY